MFKDFPNKFVNAHMKKSNTFMAIKSTFQMNKNVPLKIRPCH